VNLIGKVSYKLSPLLELVDRYVMTIEKSFDATLLHS